MKSFIEHLRQGLYENNPLSAIRARRQHALRPGGAFNPDLPPPTIQGTPGITGKGKFSKKWIAKKLVKMKDKHGKPLINRANPVLSSGAYGSPQQTHPRDGLKNLRSKMRASKAKIDDTNRLYNIVGGQGEPVKRVLKKSKIKTVSGQQMRGGVNPPQP